MIKNKQHMTINIRREVRRRPTAPLCFIVGGGYQEYKSTIAENKNSQFDK